MVRSAGGPMRDAIPPRMRIQFSRAVFPWNKPKV